MSAYDDIHAVTIYAAASRRARWSPRGVFIAIPLYFYMWLGFNRDFPPFAPYTYVGLTLILAIWWVWKLHSAQRLPQTPLAIPIVGIAVASLISTIFSVDWRLSFDGLLATFAAVLFFFVVCDLLLNGWTIDTFVHGLLIFMTLVLAQALGTIWTWYASWYRQSVPGYPMFPVPFRIYGVADHPNLLAGLLSMVLPFAIVSLVRARTYWQQGAWAVWLLAGTIVLLHTRSRGGWISAGVALSVTVGMLCWQRRPSNCRFDRRSLVRWLRSTWRLLLVTLGYLCIFASLFLWIGFASPSAYTTNGGSVLSGAGRIHFWSVAWHNFIAHPWTGSGPLTYGRAYLDGTSAVRGWVSPHAHNIVLHTLAEQGLVGLAALGGVSIGALVMLRGAKARLTERSLDSKGLQQQLTLLCAVAAVTGFAVHNLFDVLTWRPANTAVLVLVVAIGSHAAAMLHRDTRRMSRSMALILVAPIVLGAVLLQQGAAHQAQLQAVASGRAGDWQAATALMDAATARDPFYAFYNSQRAYASAVLAFDHNAVYRPSLERALASYALALRNEPAYVPTMINAATLLSSAGDVVQSEQLFRQAVNHGHDWALPSLLLGQRYLGQNRHREATSLFVQAFGREGHAPKMIACQMQPACVDAAKQFQAGAAGDPARSVEQITAAAQQLLDLARPQDALDVLGRVPMSNANPQVWLRRASAHTRLGQAKHASYAVRVAQIVGASTPSFAAQAALVEAEHYAAQDRYQDAIAALERVARPTRSDALYSYDVYWRIGLPGVLLPNLELLQRTADDLAVFKQLSTLYARAGQHDEAAWATEQAQMLERLLHPAASRSQ